MALPSSGPISMSMVNAELGISPVTTQISLNQSTVRTLFAKASGQIAMSDGWGKSAQTFTNVVTFATSGNWTVPSGVSSILVKLWGAGGGSGTGGRGGGGGYIGGYASVTPGNTVYVGVGAAGIFFDSPEYCGEGAEHGTNDYGTRGHYTILYVNSSTYMIAGGGGGGGNVQWYANGQWYYSQGGAGGGTNGANATDVYNGLYPDYGRGATGGTGGAGGNNSVYNTYNGGNFGAPTIVGYGVDGFVGTSYIMPGGGEGGQVGGDPDQCGIPGVWSAIGGEGGSGWAGGGGGYAAGGGGASSNHANFTTVTNTGGSATAPGNNGDANYSSGKGVGATTGGGGGGNGYAVIIY